MINKLKNVMMVYTSGWTFWLILGVSLIVFFVPPFVTRGTRHTNVLPKPSAWTITTIRQEHRSMLPVVEAQDEQKTKSAAKRRNRVQSLIDAYSRIDRGEILWKNFDESADGVRIQANHDYSMWERLERMPNLKMLDMHFNNFVDNRNYTKSEIEQLRRHGIATVNDLKNLKKLKTLKSFRAPSGNYSKQDLKYLESLNSLTWLDISSSRLENGLESLPICKSLEKLEIRDSSQLTKNAIEHLNKFPNLKAIYVPSFDVAKNGEQLMDKAIAKQIELVRELKNIKTLYLPHMMVYGPYAVPLGSTDFKVYPSSVNATRINATTFYQFFLAALSISIGVVLVSQFSRPESQLTPQYGLPHCLIAGFLLLLCVASSSIALVSFKVKLLSAMVLSMIAMTPIILMVLPKKFYTQGYIVILTVLPVIQLIAYGTYLNVVFEEFLIGKHVAIAVVVGLFALAILVLALYRMRYLHSILTDRGISVPIMGLHDTNRLKSEGVANPKNAFQSWILSLNFPTEIQFKKLLAFKNLSTYEKNFQAWKIPTGKTSSWMMKLAVVLLLFIQGNWFFQTWINEASPSFEKPMYFMTWVMMLIMCGYFGSLSTSGWWQRTPMFSRELCLPLTRSEMIQNLYRALLGDVIWIPFVISIFGSPIFLVSHTLPQALIWILAFFTSSFGVICIIYGTALFALSLTKSWQRLTLAISIIAFFGAIIAAIGTIVLPDVLSNTKSEFYNLAGIQRTIFGTGILFFAIGAMLTYTARDRWNKLEFAKLV